MGLIIFAKYFWGRVQRCSMTHQDAATALALYFVYPAILYLLIDKFHGLCGPAKYLEKAKAIAVNETFYMPFTALMRTHKLLSIILFQAQASNKDGEDENKSNNGRQSSSRATPTRAVSSSSKRSTTSLKSSSPSSGGNRRRIHSVDDDARDHTSSTTTNEDNDNNGSSDDDDDDESDSDYDDDDDDDDDDDGCTRQKCRVWFHLSQELTAVCCVAFLLLVCLPVLAFWFMFLGIIASSICLFCLLKRLWREAHVSTYAMSQRQNPPSRQDDVEFQEFLRNFT
jgi:hypothetical protein